MHKVVKLEKKSNEKLFASDYIGKAYIIVETL